MDKTWEQLCADHPALRRPGVEAVALKALTGRGTPPPAPAFAQELAAGFGPGRRGAAVNVAAAAKALGRSPSTVRRWLTGASQPTALDLQRTQLAAAYGPRATPADIAAKTGVTIRTARGWLAGKHRPNAAHRHTIATAASNQTLLKTAFGDKTDQQVATATGASVATVRRWRLGQASPGAKYRAAIDQQRVADLGRRHLHQVRQPRAVVKISGQQGPNIASKDDPAVFRSYFRYRVISRDVDPDEAIDAWSRDGKVGFFNWLDQRGQDYGDQFGERWIFETLPDIEITED